MIVWEFHFERGTVALESGEFFDATRQANCRWYRKLHFQEPVDFQSFEILYEHVDGRYLLLRYEDCRREEMENCPEKKFWRGPRTATGREVSIEDAVLWLLAAQFSVSPKIRRALECAKRPRMQQDARPSDYWTSRVTVGTQSHELAAELNWHDFAKRAYLRLLGLLRTLRAKHGEAIRRELLHCGMFDHYRVTVDTWWGGDTVLPPPNVSIDQVPGSSEEREFLTPLLAVRDLLRAPAACFQAVVTLAHTDDAPTPEELHRAETLLVDAIPAIESAAIDLKVAITNYEHRRVDEDWKEPEEAEDTDSATRRTKRISLDTAERKIVMALIEHLRGARDLMQSTSDSADGPRILPRPTQAELSRLAEVKEYHVTRVLRMPGTKALLLWEAALDPEQILRMPLPRR